MELGSALAIPDPARDPGGSGVGRWENLSLSRIEEVLKAPLVPRGARNWLQDLGETRQGPGGGVPPPKALTTSVVLGTEGVSTGDLKRCPQDRPASGRSWQLSKARPGSKGQCANEASPWAHQQCPGKPGTEFKRPGPLFSLGMQQQRPTECHAASSADIVSCPLGLPWDHPKARLHLPRCMSRVSTHSQDRPCVVRWPLCSWQLHPAGKVLTAPGTPAAHHMYCPASSQGTQPSASHASYIPHPPDPPPFP